MTDSKLLPVALVTGASQRIGRAIIESLHNDNYRVVIHFHQNEQAAIALAKQLNQIKPETAIAFAADLNHPDEIEKLARQAARQWGRLDVLVNNASVFKPNPSELNDTLDLLQQSMDINVRAAFILTRLLQAELTKSQGNIINLVDIYSERPLASHSVYCISKAAIAMLTKSQALELAPDIRVNGISPGAILWPENQVNSQQQQSILEKIPLARLGSTTAITETIHYLLRCDYITGQIIRIDGGRSIVI